MLEANEIVVQLPWWHVVFHHLDWIAPCFTLGGIALIAYRKRAGWLVASAGSILWFVIAMTGTFAGRPIWGQAVLSVATIALNTRAWFLWKRM